MPPGTDCGALTPYRDSDTGVAGAVLTVNVPVADGAVTAGRPALETVSGALSP